MAKVSKVKTLRVVGEGYEGSIQRCVEVAFPLFVSGQADYIELLFDFHGARWWKAYKIEKPVRWYLMRKEWLVGGCEWVTINGLNGVVLHQMDSGAEVGRKRVATFNEQCIPWEHRGRLGRISELVTRFYPW